jgi:hypothetical protein
LRCGRTEREGMRGKSVLCGLCDPDPLIPTGWKDLVDKDKRGRYRQAPGGWAHKFVPSEAPRGRPVTGETGPDEIVTALVGYSARVRCVIGRDGVIRPKRRSWQQYRGGLAASVEGANTKVLAAVLGEKPDWVRDWRRKNHANSPHREVDSMQPTKADLNELREEALHADVRASLVILLDRFPGNAAVEAAVDEFLDDTLGD